MFYAHFVLSKKGPLARIWLAAHWDKKLTKAHVFETNIDSSVEAIIQPKVKMALRTSGHLLLGVVRIYSRKAKYLLADCNEAFVKIKMAFRPGVVDLPEENREAAVATITLPETFHDFDTTMADLNDIDVQAQFSVNQSRPEEITMKEDLGNITLVGDDGFGDMDHMGFDENEMMRGGSGMDETLFKNAEPALIEENEKDQSAEKMDINDDDLGGGFGGVYDDDDDDDGGPPGAPSDDDEDFGGGVDHELFGENFMEAGGLFEDPPMPEVSIAPEPDPTQLPVSQKEAADTDAPPGLTEEDLVLHQAETASTTTTGVADNTAMTTLVQNDKEAFALEPLDITSVPGHERKGKRKRKLIVDDQKGIASETMKLQLSDTSDIVTTLDLAPPTKKLMHWKETGGVEKLFALPGRPIVSKKVSKLFYKNLITRPVTDFVEEDPLELEAPRDEEHEMEQQFADVSSILPDRSELSIREPRRSRRGPPIVDTSSTDMPPPPVPELPGSHPVPTPAAVAAAVVAAMSEPPKSPSSHPLVAPEQPQPEVSFSAEPEPILPNISAAEPLLPEPEPEPIQPQEEEQQPIPEEKDPEINDDIFMDNLPPLHISSDQTLNQSAEKNADDEDAEPAEGTEEFEERRWNKRSQQMLYILQRTLRKQSNTSFQEMVGNNNRKIVASKFYTLLVLKKQQAIEVEQTSPYADIVITKGPRFATVC